MKKLTLIMTAGCLLTSGCATVGAGYRPLVDLRGGDAAKFEADLSECQAYARGQAGAQAMAVAGAVVFGLVGAVLATRGHKTDVAEKLAIVGAAHGAADGIGSQHDVIRRCLSGRGYSVLN